MHNSRKPGFDVDWLLSLGQALFVSGLSLYFAVEAGHRLGGSYDGQRLVAGGAILAVLNAHLLMAISRRASAGLRLWPSRYGWKSRLVALDQR